MKVFKRVFSVCSKSSLAVRTLQEAFADEKMCEEKLNELASLAKDIHPSLDSNDQQTLMEMLENLQLRFKQVSDAEKQKEQDLKDGAQRWRDYQVHKPPCSLLWLL